MLTIKQLFLPAVLVGASASSAFAQAAEICGNSIDDDADGFADESCYPGLTNPLVDNPLSTADTGLISPSTGSLYYPIKPDITTKQPFGPHIVFRRTYVSKMDLGGSPPAYKKPLGDHWIHNFMGWLVENGSTLTIRLPTGQEIIATSSGPCTFATRAGQATQGVDHCTSPDEYRVKMLDGSSLRYRRLAPGGPVMLDEVAQPTGALAITHDASYRVAQVTAAAGALLTFSYGSGQLDLVTLTDAIGFPTTMQASFSYTSNNLTSVSSAIGGQTYTYTNALLTEIKDPANNSLVKFAYDSAVAGKAARIDTSRGTVGFEFASTRTGCSGSNKTVLYFNKGNTTSCTSDGDCGSGFLCGGKTGTGATGQCFRAARCLTVDTTAGHHEDLVTSVTAIGPPGESCDGACTDVAQYLWNNTATFVASLGIQDPAGSFTVREVNANGLPTHITYGDPDTNPINGNAAREVWLKYNSVEFPGLVTEIRRKSDLHPQSGSCSPSAGDPCQITSIQYKAGVGKPEIVTETGTTLSTDGAGVVTPTLYTYVTTYSYDTLGRLTQIDGPLPGSSDLTTITYHPVFGFSSDNYPEWVCRNKDASNSVCTYLFAYDQLGNVIKMRGGDTDGFHPIGTWTCLDYEPSSGNQTSRIDRMAGQTCQGALDPADLDVSFAYDSAKRLSSTKRPDGSWLFYEYDTRGRLARIKRRDDGNPASSGDRKEFIYDVDGLLSEVQTYDAASAMTAKQPYTYYDSRRLQQILNPVNTAKSTILSYDSRGLLSMIEGPDHIGKTVFNRAGLEGADGRVTSVDKYKTGSTFDTWSLVYSLPGEQTRVIDGDSKSTNTTRDDKGRIVQLETPDMTGTTTYTFDEASRLVKIVENAGTGTPRIHTFTYDLMGRQLVSNYHGGCSSSEIELQYDQAKTPGGAPSCPVGMNCYRTGGRVAYEKVSLMCSASYGDGSLDQETWFQYDDGGRLVREYIKDDSGRIADHLFAWTKNGALQQSTMPSGAVIGATFGSASINSDTDRVTGLWRTNTSTPVVDAITWFPFGPLKQYNQQNKISNKLQRTAISRNLAYRITNVAVENQTNGSDTFAVTIGEDTKGRVIKRDYSAAATGVQDSYVLYDDQDRVMCETTSLVASCPTSGSNIKNSRGTPAFTNAGDWREFLRPVPGSTGLVNSFNPSGYGTSHQVTMVRQNDGTPQLGDTILQYDSRGNRISDDNTSTLTNDARTYTYDERHNVINVHGKYFTGGVWHDYDVASAFDARNRRVMKSFKDASTGVEAQWFFYYDAMDRLAQVRHTPNVTLPLTHTLFEFFWLGDRLVLFWQADLPTGTSSRRYVGTDESGRPIDMWSWPASGNATRTWAINPSAWGFDTNVVGPSVFQPILFAGQYIDSETAALSNGGSTVHRPGTVLNGFRTYDPVTAAYLQVDPRGDESWSNYVYAQSDPVGKSDPDGMLAVEVTVQWGDNPCSFGASVFEHGKSIEGGATQCWFTFAWDPTTWGDDGPWIPTDSDPTKKCNRETCKNNNYDYCNCLSCYRRCEMECGGSLETECIDRCYKRPIYESSALTCNDICSCPGNRADCSYTSDPQRDWQQYCGITRQAGESRLPLRGISVTQ